MKAHAILLFAIGIADLIVSICENKPHQYIIVVMCIFLGWLCWRHRNDDKDDEVFRNTKTWSDDEIR